MIRTARYTTSQINYLTSAVADPPTQLEVAAVLRLQRNALLGYKDQAGDPFWTGQNPRLIVMCSNTLFSTVDSIRVADSLTGPIGNDLKGVFETRLNPYLTAGSGSVWWVFMFNASSVRKPFIFQLAGGVTLEDDMGMQNEFDTKDVTFSAFYYGNAGYGEWRTAHGYKMT